MREKYWLFASDDYYSSGGVGDLIGIYDDLDDFTGLVKQSEEGLHPTVRVYSTYTFCIVYNNILTRWCVWSYTGDWYDWQDIPKEKWQWIPSPQQIEEESEGA